MTTRAGNGGPREQSNSMSVPRPRDETPSDAESVADAAAALQVSDYAVFELAFRSWYGRVGADAELARHFGAFLSRGTAPHWVRHYCRMGRGAAGVREAPVPISKARCLAVGGYLVLCLLISCGLVVLY